MTSLRRVRWLAAAVALSSGCATLEAPFSGHLQSAAPQERECAEWFQTLDARVDAAGVRDAQDARMAGFPYLRVESSARVAAAGRRGGRRSPAGACRAHAGARSRGAALRDHEPAGRADRGHARRFGSCRAAHGAGPHAELRATAARYRPGAAGGPASPAASARPSRTITVRCIASSACIRSPDSPLPRACAATRKKRGAAFLAEPSLPPGASLLRLAPPPGEGLSRARAALILERAASQSARHPAAGRAGTAGVASPPTRRASTSRSRADYDRFGALRWLRGEAVPRGRRRRAGRSTRIRPGRATGTACCCSSSTRSGSRSGRRSRRATSSPATSTASSGA